MLTDVRTQPLSWKGVVFLAMAGLIVMGLQTTVAAWGGPWGYGPDLGLIMILYMGLNVPTAPGAALAVFLGLVKDTAGGGDFGFYAGIFLILFLLAAQVRKKIDPSTPYYLVLFTLAFALTAGLLAWLFLFFLGWSFQYRPGGLDRPVTLQLISSGVTAVAGPFLFSFLDLFRMKNGAHREQDT